MAQAKELISQTSIGQIITNIIGGALVALLTWAYLKLKGKCYKRAFKKIFGEDIERFFTVYGRMKIISSFDRNGKSIQWPYFKPGTKHVFNISSPISFTGIKSASYLSGAFGKIIRIAPELISDEEIQDKLDLSFCSFGGYNNFKTVDVLENDENIFFDFDVTNPSHIFAKETSKKFTIDGVYDYGFIIKIKPKLFPYRTWIAVAGLGESGTSGAAWFLSRKWKEIEKRVGKKPFGLIIRTKIGKDESAEIVYQKVKEK